MRRLAAWLLVLLAGLLPACMSLPYADPGPVPASIVVEIDTWADCGEILQALRALDRAHRPLYALEPGRPGPFWQLKVELMADGKPVQRLGAKKGGEFKPGVGSNLKTKAEFLAPPGDLKLKISLGAWVRRYYRRAWPYGGRYSWGGYGRWDYWHEDASMMRSRDLESAAMVRELDLKLLPGATHVVKLIKEPGPGRCQDKKGSAGSE